MARYKFEGIHRDKFGHVVVSGTVSVFLSGTSTPANIYTTLAGAVSTTSVTCSATDGSFSFYVDDFDYDTDQKFKITLSKSGYTTQTYDDRMGTAVLGNYTISTAKTVTTHVRCPKGVTYTKSGSGTIAFNGGFEAGLYQCFISFASGNITFANTKEVYPEWWGIDGTADEAEINLALGSVGTTIPVVLSAKTYTTAAGISFAVGKKLIGQGVEKTKIYANFTGSTPAILIKGTGGAIVNYPHLEGFTLYGNSGAMLNTALEMDYVLSPTIRNVFIEYFAVTALNLLTVWEPVFENVRLVQCGASGTSSTGVINFSTSAVVAGQTTEGNFTDLIMGSCFGTHIRMRNANGTSAINFNNLIIETDLANNAATDDLPLIDFSTCSFINFNNFYINYNTHTTSTSSAYIIRSANATNESINFANGTLSTGDANLNASLAGMVYFDNNYGCIGFNNVEFRDLYDKIPANAFFVATYGGTSKILLSKCGFNSSKAVTALFPQVVWIEGDFYITRTGAYTYYDWNFPATLTVNSTTPTVANHTAWQTLNTAPTTITNFTNGYVGKKITVNFLDANTTISFVGASIKGNAGVNFTAAATEYMECIYDGTIWRCTPHR